MSNHDDETTRPPADKRRKLIVAGAASLAVVAGGGAYLMATRDAGTETRDTSAVAPLVVPSSAETTSAETPLADASSAPASPAPSSAAAAATATAKSAPKAKPTDDAAVRREIEEARAKAASEGHVLQRPLKAPQQVRAQNAGPATEETKTLPDGGTMRIISAKHDLSSQREMLWAADEGKPVDGAHCTQNFRFAENAKPAVRPTMMLCWHNSAARSVVVLTVTKKDIPSMKQGAAAVAAQWDKLG